MKNKFKIIIFISAIILAVVGGLFIYEVKKEHHYTPVTAEIVIDSEDTIKNAFIIKDGVMPTLNLSEHLTFVSDVENGTANLETTKKVFGFYECEINRVYDEYLPAVSYKSSNTDIAEADENGVITSKTKGETVITVTADNITLDIPVTVYRGIEIAELEQNIVLLKGESKSFLSVEEYDVVLSEFYSSDENVASVNKNGTVTANSKGKAEIYTYKDDEKISTQITVKQPVES
ncbi:MAG: Ig-like domain-containing protein, partial [Oscillospiraceae bacterium]|nr:Ig-like domain-containing protein [Oscillospiraceae bacterium]